MGDENKSNSTNKSTEQKLTPHQQVKIMFVPDYRQKKMNNCHVTFSYRGEWGIQLFTEKCNAFLEKWKAGKTEGSTDSQKRIRFRRKIVQEMMYVKLKEILSNANLQLHDNEEINWSGMSITHFQAFMDSERGDLLFDIQNVPTFFVSPCRSVHTHKDLEPWFMYITVCERYHTNGNKVLKSLQYMYRKRRETDPHEIEEKAGKSLDMVVDVWYRRKPTNPFTHIGDFTTETMVWSFQSGKLKEVEGVQSQLDESIYDKFNFLFHEKKLTKLPNPRMSPKHAKGKGVKPQEIEESWQDDSDVRLWGNCKLMHELVSLKQVMFVPKVVSYVEILHSGSHETRAGQNEDMATNFKVLTYSRIHTATWNFPRALDAWVREFHRLQKNVGVDNFTEITVEQKRYVYKYRPSFIPHPDLGRVINGYDLILVDKRSNTEDTSAVEGRPADFKIFEVKYFVKGVSHTMKYALCLQDAEFPIGSGDDGVTPQSVPKRDILSVEKSVFTTPLTLSLSRAEADPFQEKQRTLPPQDTFLNTGFDF